MQMYFNVCIMPSRNIGDMLINANNVMTKVTAQDDILANINIPLVMSATTIIDCSIHKVFDQHDNLE